MGRNNTRRKQIGGLLGRRSKNTNSLEDGLTMHIGTMFNDVTIRGSIFFYFDRLNEYVKNIELGYTLLNKIKEHEPYQVECNNLDEKINKYENMLKRVTVDAHQHTLREKSRDKLPPDAPEVTIKGGNVYEKITDLNNKLEYIKRAMDIDTTIKFMLQNMLASFFPIIEETFTFFIPIIKRKKIPISLHNDINEWMRNHQGIRDEIIEKIKETRVPNNIVEGMKMQLSSVDTIKTDTAPSPSDAEASTEPVPNPTNDELANETNLGSGGRIRRETYEKGRKKRRTSKSGKKRKTHKKGGKRRRRTTKSGKKRIY